MVARVSCLSARVGSETDALGRDRRVGQAGAALGDPAGEFDVGLQPSGVKARIEVAVLDRAPLLQDVAVVEADAVARAHARREVTQALGLLELAGTHWTAPAVATARA